MCSPSYGFHVTPVVACMCVYTARKMYYINYKKVLEQARRKQLSVGPAGRNERAKCPLGCLWHAPRNILGFQTFLRSFLVQSEGEIA